MLNLDEPQNSSSFYILQRDVYIRILSYAASIITFINIIRTQVSEVSLLQLIPGFYLFLMFTSLILLVAGSDFFVRFGINTDTKKSTGTKTLFKIQEILQERIIIFFFINTLLAALLTIVPLSLDSFNNYGEKTLENIWSFDEVIALETTLLITISAIGQVPIYAIPNVDCERKISLLPRLWRIFTLIVLIIAGFLTPTIDGYTQLGFSAAAIFLYVIIIQLIQKRLHKKFIGVNFLGY